MTREEAIKLAKTEWWKYTDAETIVAFQLYEEKLCMPFTDFHKAIEKVLGRPVFSHELAFVDRLRIEHKGGKPKPTFEEIVELIPEEKRLLLVIKDK
jgi:hypothetical protein